jgi:hypothetical protein
MPRGDLLDFARSAATAGASGTLNSLMSSSMAVASSGALTRPRYCPLARTSVMRHSRKAQKKTGSESDTRRNECSSDEFYPARRWLFAAPLAPFGVRVLTLAFCFVGAFLLVRRGSASDAYS